MRKIGRKEIDDIAMGAALLGAGGGGDPYIGKLIAFGAVDECGPATLISPEELDDDALIVSIAMMGVPTVVCEKGINGGEYKKLFEMVSNFFGRPVDAIMPLEAGGLNSMLPIAAAARLGIPMVDCDGMGRAFPEMQMLTFTIGGVSSSPMALVDEKGNSVIFKTINNKWTEELSRAVVMSCGGACSIACYTITGKILKEYGVKDIVTKSEELGKVIKNIKSDPNVSPEEVFAKASDGIKLFKGKIKDVLRETDGAFNYGRVLFDGIGEYKGHTAEITIQNENITASVDGEYVCTVPDLVCVLDAETFIPVTTDALKYGKRAYIYGLPCFPLWRTEKGLELVGPQYFHVNTEYVPVEERSKGGRADV